MVSKYIDDTILLNTMDSEQFICLLVVWCEIGSKKQSKWVLFSGLEAASDSQLWPIRLRTALWLDLVSSQRGLELRGVWENTSISQCVKLLQNPKFLYVLRLMLNPLIPWNSAPPRYYLNNWGIHCKFGYFEGRDITILLPNMVYYTKDTDN